MPCRYMGAVAAAAITLGLVGVAIAQQNGEVNLTNKTPEAFEVIVERLAEAIALYGRWTSGGIFCLCFFVLERMGKATNPLDFCGSWKFHVICLAVFLHYWVTACEQGNDFLPMTRKIFDEQFKMIDLCSNLLEAGWKLSMVKIVLNCILALGFALPCGLAYLTGQWSAAYVFMIVSAVTLENGRVHLRFKFLCHLPVRPSNIIGVVAMFLGGMHLRNYSDRSDVICYSVCAFCWALQILLADAISELFWPDGTNVDPNRFIGQLMINPSVPWNLQRRCCLLWSSKQFNERIVASMENLFRRADADGNGQINGEEFREFIGSDRRTLDNILKAHEMYVKMGQLRNE